MDETTLTTGTHRYTSFLSRCKTTIRNTREGKRLNDELSNLPSFAGKTKGRLVTQLYPILLSIIVGVSPEVTRELPSSHGLFCLLMARPCVWVYAWNGEPATKDLSHYQSWAPIIAIGAQPRLTTIHNEIFKHTNTTNKQFAMELPQCETDMCVKYLLSCGCDVGLFDDTCDVDGASLTLLCGARITALCSVLSHKLHFGLTHLQHLPETLSASFWFPPTMLQ